MNYLFFYFKKNLVVILFINCTSVAWGNENSLCKYKSNLDVHYKKIKNILSSKNIFTDSCILSTLDSISTKYKKAPNPKYLSLIDNAAIFSDGYISEHLKDIIEEICINDFEGLINYICKQRESYQQKGINGYLLELIIHANVKSDFFKQVSLFFYEKRTTKNYCECYKRIETEFNKRAKK